MNNQIKEMVKIMNETCNVYDEQGNHIRNKCSECDCWSDDNHCCCSYNNKEAEALYNAGYRKENTGEWIDAPNTAFGHKSYRCSNCNYRIGVVRTYPKYCSNCGAKMKGAE